MNVVLCLFVLIAAAHGANLREALKIIPDNLEGHSSPISNAEALNSSINKDKKCVPKPKYPNCFQICQICIICQSKVDHENNEPHRGKREPATEESRLKDPTTNDAPSRINNTKPKTPTCDQICQICQICQSKLPASVDHENNEPHRGKREPATEESRLKDRTNYDAPSKMNNTIWDIRRPSDSDMKGKNDIQWMFHRLFETIVETKVRFLILTHISYFVKDIT